jgi:hypothetical protein
MGKCQQGINPDLFMDCEMLCTGLACELMHCVHVYVRNAKVGWS